MIVKVWMMHHQFAVINKSKVEHSPWWDLLLAGRYEEFLSLLHVDPNVYEQIVKFTKKMTKSWKEPSKKKVRSWLSKTYLFVDECRVCLRFGFVAVHRALQGVDDMVVGVVLVVVQNAVVHVVLRAALFKDTDTIKVQPEAFLFFDVSNQCVLPLRRTVAGGQLTAPSSPPTPGNRWRTAANSGTASQRVRATRVATNTRPAQSTTP